MPENRRDRFLGSIANEIPGSAWKPGPWYRMAIAEGETISEPSALKSGDELSDRTVRRFSSSVIGVQHIEPRLLLLKLRRRRDRDRIERVEAGIILLREHVADGIACTHVRGQPLLHRISRIPQHHDIHHRGIEQRACEGAGHRDTTPRHCGTTCEEPIQGQPSKQREHETHRQHEPVVVVQETREQRRQR